MTDNPPVSQLDLNPDVTFRAVGIALTQWELMEAALASLYSIFEGNPYSIDVIIGFGNEKRTTQSRIELVRTAGESHFIQHSDQTLKSGFTRSSKKRSRCRINDIKSPTASLR